MMLNRFVIVLTSVCGFLSITVAEAGVVVIAHPSVEEADYKSVKKLYLGKIRKLDGKLAIAVDQFERSEARVEFVDKVLGQTMNENKAYWTERIFTGTGTPPDALGYDAEAKAFVASHPGAVGYVSRDYLLDDSVKVLFRRD